MRSAGGRAAAATAATKQNTRQGEPAWHRRQRADRQRYRDLARISAGLRRLKNHHGHHGAKEGAAGEDFLGQMAGDGYPWRAALEARKGRQGKWKPYTVCPNGCERAWVFNSKLAESPTCRKCGEAFAKAGGGKKEAETTKSDAALCIQNAQLEVAREKLATFKAEGAEDKVALLYEVLPELAAEEAKPAEGGVAQISPHNALNQAHQRYMRDHRAMERAFDKAANLEIALEDAQKAAAAALVQTQKSEAELLDARKAFAARGVPGAASGSASPAAPGAKGDEEWWDFNLPTAEESKLEGPEAQLLEELRGPLLKLQLALRQKTPSNLGEGTREVKAETPAATAERADAAKRPADDNTNAEEERAEREERTKACRTTGPNDTDQDKIMQDGVVLDLAAGGDGGFPPDGGRGAGGADARDDRSRSPDRGDRARKARENQVEIAKRLAKERIVDDTENL